MYRTLFYWHYRSLPRSIKGQEDNLQSSVSYNAVSGLVYRMAVG